MKKHITYLIVFLVFTLLLTPSIVSLNIEESEVESLYSNSGNRIFGLIGIIYNNETSEGLPKPEFEGLLFNVNATFLGYKDFIVVNNLFRPLKNVVIQTNSTMNVKMKIFRGIVHYNESVDKSAAVGFALGIHWNVF